MLRETFQILLASNFEELAPVRAALRERIDGFSVLPIRCLDLNDARPRHDTPLWVSLEMVGRSDILVLLVGRRYGGCPPGETKSYAHLEYEAALDTGDAIVILPYLIGWPSVEDACAADDPRLASWCRTLAVEHTVGVIPPGMDERIVSESVLLDIQAAVFDLLTEAQRHTLDRLDALDGADESGPSFDELEALDSGTPEDAGQAVRRDQDDTISEAEALRAPARMAAIEQREQAFKALKLGERAVALAHLRRALELLPLDLATGYWLARLLVLSGRRGACREAESFARRAARVAESEGRPLYTASSLLVASRAAARLGEHARAVETARRAVDVAGWYAAAHAELGARLAEAGDLDAGLDAISDAFFRHPTTALRALRREEVFRRHGTRVEPYLNGLLDRVREAVAEVLASNHRLAVDSVSSEDHLVVKQKETARSHTMDILRQLALARESTSGQVTLLTDHLRLVGTELRRNEEVLQEMRGALRDLGENQHREATALAEERPRLEPIVAGGSLFLALLSAAALRSPTALVAFLTIAVLGNVARLFYRRRAAARRRQQVAQRHESERLGLQQQISRRAEESAARLRSMGEAFATLLDSFERTCLRWAILSPTRGLGKAEPGDLVRLHPDRRPGGYRLSLDHHRLPPELRERVALPDEAREPHHRLYRVLERSGSSIHAARWAAFCRPPWTHS